MEFKPYPPRENFPPKKSQHGKFIGAIVLFVALPLLGGLILLVLELAPALDRFGYGVPSSTIEAPLWGFLITMGISLIIGALVSCIAVRNNDSPFPGVLISYAIFFIAFLPVSGIIYSFY